MLRSKEHEQLGACHNWEDSIYSMQSKPTKMGMDDDNLQGWLDGEPSYAHPFGNVKHGTANRKVAKSKVKHITIQSKIESIDVPNSNCLVDLFRGLSLAL